MAHSGSLGHPSLLLSEQDLEPKDKWEEIGRGGFAIVYKAYCRVHNGYVAVKKAHKESNQIREIQKLVKLSNHDHVVTIKGIYLEKNYIIMEYCSYSLQSLRDTLGKSHIPWSRCLYFMQHILSGLAYVHRENITHRDIKPANVMVTDTFVCKIADLGLAKQQESFSNSRSNSNIVQPSGSLFYISPERLKDPLKRASETDDVYSCAILFYKMITNGDLFYMETRRQDESVLNDLKHYLLDKEYRHDLHNLGPEPVPDIVVKVIGSCWHTEPTKRETFQHWSKFLRDHVDAKVSKEELRKADEELNHLLEAGKASEKSCNPKKSADLGSKNKGRDEDRTDSVGQEEPQAARGEETENQRGSGDGLESCEHEKYSGSKAVDDLETSMGNLTVESEGTDVFVLSVNYLVTRHYNLCTGEPYKLTLDKEAKEFCFSTGCSSPARIPIRNIKDYKREKEEETMTFYIWSKKKNEFHPLTLSASSISRIIADLEDIGWHSSESEALPLRADNHSSETVSDSGHRKNSLPSHRNGGATSSDHLNQFRHSQSVPNNLPGWSNYPPNNHQGESNYELHHNYFGPYQNNPGPNQNYGGQHQNVGGLPQNYCTPPQNSLGSPHIRPFGQQPFFGPPNQPPLTVYPTGQPASMPAPSYISIHHVENFYHSQCPPSLTSPPSTIPNPPYQPNELTNSAREVDDIEDIPQLQDHVATKYDTVAAVLGMTNVGKIKLEESFNNRPEASYQLLYEWHQQNGSKATVKKLAWVLYCAGLYEAAKLLT